jgi:uncharacterized protein YndB with AHSA1/START domain
MTANTQEAPATATTDRIDKRVELRAPRSRVWRAISDAREFETWFHMKIDGDFAAGRTVHGKVQNKRFEDANPIEITIERIEPERYFSYRWHPFALDPKVDYSVEPTTLVEFTIDEAPDGCVVTIVESGFDNIPLARRAEAFKMNEGGWNGQAKNLTAYVA